MRVSEVVRCVFFVGVVCPCVCSCAMCACLVLSFMERGVRCKVGVAGEESTRGRRCERVQAERQEGRRSECQQYRTVKTVAT